MVYSLVSFDDHLVAACLAASSGFNSLQMQQRPTLRPIKDDNNNHETRVRSDGRSCRELVVQTITRTLGLIIAVQLERT